VILAAAMPPIFPGLPNAIVLSFVLMIASELLVRRQGLGYLFGISAITGVIIGIHRPLSPMRWFFDSIVSIGNPLPKTARVPACRY
jgi:ABC-type nitrate/sulfonate/bicarbonate transport system permease component